jgi:hypothetical protein
LSYPLDPLYEEVAYVAYHFHWSMEEILNMEHDDRGYWVNEIDKINQRRNEEDLERIKALRGQSGLSSYM